MPCKKSTLLILQISLFIFPGCLKDVPHDNPFDPASDNYGFEIRGSIQTYYDPTEPIPGALVLLDSLKEKTLTNAAGVFSFPGLLPGQYTLIVSAKTFATETTLVDLAFDTRKDINLDALPVFENIELTTHHESRYYPIGDRFFLDIKANVYDPDGVSDIDKVNFAVYKFGTDSIIVQDTLSASINQGEFTALVNVAELNVDNIQNIVGHEFVFHVKDDVGKSTSSRNYYISRVLDDTLKIKETVIAPDSIFFSWHELNLPFHIEQQIQIFLVNVGVLSQYRATETFDQNLTKYAIKNDLPLGEYVWLLIHRDDFGNTNRSKEILFTITGTQ